MFHVKERHKTYRNDIGLIRKTVFMWYKICFHGQVDKIRKIFFFL